MLLLVFFLFSINTVAQEYRTSVDVRVPLRVESAIVNSRTMVYYEIYLTNFSSKVLELELLEVINENLTAVSYDSDRLSGVVKKVGTSYVHATPTIHPGAVSIIFLEYELPKLDTFRVLHHFAVREVASEEKFNVQTEDVTIINPSPMILGNPLSGGPWAAIYSPAWDRGHRRVTYTINGKARIPGRLAIDFIKLDKKGRYASNDPDRIANWYGYNSQVLAVADGVIASIDDSYPESTTISEHPSLTGEKGAGNYISIKIGKETFAFYEHLKPGSIRVKVGQEVKKGEVIANLGFTGSTQSPHLHFHLADKDSPLGGDGVPFAFESFELLGAYNDFSLFGKELWDTKGVGSLGIKRNERPIENAVVVFK